MLNKILFFVIILLLTVNTISASVDLKSDEIPLNGNLEVTIDLPTYGNFVYLVREVEDLFKIVQVLDLGCIYSCSGEKNIEVSLPLEKFPAGDYFLYVLSISPNVKSSLEWIIVPFKVVSDLPAPIISPGNFSQPINPILEISNSPNEKLDSAYSNKEVFLVSDKEWKKVLPAISAGIWTDSSGQIHSYPFLIFHEEEERNSLDADSIIYFMQQYSPSKVTLIGNTPSQLDNLLIANKDFGAGLSSTQIQRLSSAELFNYWESFDSLVYVKDNYGLSLLASTYASLINAPLVIEGEELDLPSTFSGRKIICVGDVVPSENSCYESYNLDSLRTKYKSLTNTDKIILINPNDLFLPQSLPQNDFFYPEKSTRGIQELYFKDSLTAPILASARHELIVSTNKTNYEDISNFIHSKLSGMKYLTILASPSILPNKEFKGEYLGMDIYWAIDSSHYSDINGDKVSDVAVGRISGISVSDISSYIARDLFYSSFAKYNNMKFMASSFYGYLEGVTIDISNKFKSAGYNAVSSTSSEESFEFNPEEWKNQDLIYYTDHGARSWSGIYSSAIPSLDNSLVLSASCLTASSYDQSSFWARAIRKGAIGYIGAVSITYLSLDYAYFLNEVYVNSKNIGTAFKDSRSPIVSTTFGAMTTLIGDPVLDINPSYLLPSEVNPICSGRDLLCLSNGNCCSGLECKWFSCKSCRSKNSFCLNKGDCCSNKCRWLKCR